MGDMNTTLIKTRLGKSIMDLRWAYCLQNGMPLGMDVYDLAASSCLCELTETSVRNRSKSIGIPDFTRGA